MLINRLLIKKQEKRNKDRHKTGIISVDPSYRDSLQFLWLNFDSNNLDFYIYQFTSVLFGLMCSPFLLNGTLKHHFQSNWFRDLFEKFILEKLFRDLYVDN